ncbi:MULTISPECIES: 3-hydroxyacyl-CoA dehydrogenase [Marinomonas]|uniref:NAD(P)-dependent dehydrogenase (Short-subunit alcohol dehydrogenase family) n=1 Tax=Marinomonas balearica TaxID=491947 RepID=A0A4R6MED6_9GAMM|nr:MULTISPECIES: 3-hydroxyacyl-CoA dehydrogenase [Marinomonas]TDO99605.1 NAD(P)-dependent dehydrogenase (short-subunit alcohol dehydrogenase family) [Marinomonas balearica]WCN09787.1 SDR family NAD(P)-dependent oxidoreductase [Marinomonas mediterranea]
MQVKGNHFVVTGSASGIGEAVARRLHSLGASVSLADVNEEGLKRVAQSLGERVSYAVTDISSEESVQASLDAAENAFGSIYGVVNCAGIPGAERVVGREGPHRFETFERAIRVNLMGTFNMIRLAANKMQENEPLDTTERGVIINTASVAAYDGQIGQAAYAASKGGVVSMTLPIARELARFGIRVMTIAPGIFKTPMMDVLPEEVQQSLGEAVPFPPRLGDPDEFAGLAQHIIENCMLNGEVIRLDGAIRMAAK